jgi:hypothetical protein
MNADSKEPPVRSSLRRLKGISALFCLLAGLAAPGSMRTVSAEPPPAPVTLTPGSLIPDWSFLADEPYPLWPATVGNPVLTAADVTDAFATFVADPFLFHDHDNWYMFLEVFNMLDSRGEIALATSVDGLHWTYEQIILAEAWHQSFPCVFEFDHVYYMVPESGAHNDVRLYRALDFPRSWVYQATLVSGRPFADPTIFRYGGTWWMFVSRAGGDRCFLYYSDNLSWGWTEHPLSPVVNNDPSKARPAGRGIVLAGDRIIRLAQKCDVVYGQGVRAFRVDQLDRTHYQEHEIPESPILFASGSGWNAEGMHTCDPWWVGDHWIAAVDGTGPGGWCIGIYQTASDASAVDSRADPLSGKLRVGPSLPNPFGARTTIRYEIPGSGLPDPVDVEIYDSDGRFVSRLAEGVRLPGRHDAEWTGKDYLGRPVACGLYLCRVRQGGRSATQRICLIR